ncbi:MAG TPA: hypothetical protein VHZ73_13430 [Vicinamibacterales bacterium]|nr:hypothetical protein [Vicinamibacterales bacterium]
MVAALALAAALVQQQPVPRPFPGSSTPPSRPATSSPPPVATPPAPAATVPPAASKPVAVDGAPTDASMGVQIYPGAQFLTSYDAGRGQRFYLFGSTASFTDLVTWYRNVLKQRGELIFESPATQEFDVGRFREESMAFPPGVTIKEYKSEMSEGYPNPKAGAQPARFPTVIQIVPLGPDR